MSPSGSISYPLRREMQQEYAAGHQLVMPLKGGLPVIGAIVVLPGIHLACHARFRPPAINDGDEPVTVIQPGLKVGIGPLARFSRSPLAPLRNRSNPIARPQLMPLVAKLTPRWTFPQFHLQRRDQARPLLDRLRHHSTYVAEAVRLLQASAAARAAPVKLIRPVAQICKGIRLVRRIRTKPVLWQQLRSG